MRDGCYECPFCGLLYVIGIARDDHARRCPQRGEADA